MWIPNNEVLARDRVRDTPEAARTYLHAIIGDVVPAEKIDAFVASLAKSDGRPNGRVPN